MNKFQIKNTKERNGIYEKQLGECEGPVQTTRSYLMGQKDYTLPYATPAGCVANLLMQDNRSTKHQSIICALQSLFT